MKRSYLFGLAAAAALALSSLGAMAAGVFSGYPAAVPPVTDSECIPADTNLPSGLTPATECMTAGNIAGIATRNALGNYSNVPIGSVAYGSFGTNTTDAIQLFVSSFQMPLDATITGLYCLQGATATTDKIIGALYKKNLVTGDLTMATLVANSALAGISLATGDTFKQLPFTTAYVAKAGQYFMAVQGNGTAAGAIRTVAASTFVGVAAGSVTAGSFGTIGAQITFPTTFTADKGPICYTY